MEAAVLRPQMTADVSGYNNALNAELEVKKLQELVRKLEVQNEQLRTRASTYGCLPGSSAESLSSPVPSVTPILSRSPAADDPHAYFRPRCPAGAETRDVCNGLSVLDEVQLLDLDFILPCDAESEDTWLYASPRAKPRTQFALSPLQWCRQVLDCPRPNVQAALLSFSQAHPGRDISSRPALPHGPVTIEPPPSTSARPSVKPTPRERAASLCTSSQHLPPVTQTSSGNSCFGQAERSPSFFPHSSSHCDGYRHPPQPPLGTSQLEDDSISMGYKLLDLTDVQIMARMQEESLRQDYASSSATSRSSSFIQFGRRAARSEPNGEEEEEHDQPETQQCSLPPSHSERKSRRSLLAAQCFGGRCPPQHCSPVRSSYPPQHCSPVRSSYPPQHCTPVRSSYPPQHCTPVRSSYPPHAQSQRPNIGKLRRSMPNLVRAPSAPSVPSIPGPAGSESSIRTSQSFDCSRARTRLQSSIPSPAQLQPHVRSARNFPPPPWHALRATAYVSPTMQAPSIPCSTSSAHPTLSIGLRLPSKSSGPSTMGRGIVPRPASVIGIGAVLHSNISQPVRRADYWKSQPKKFCQYCKCWIADNKPSIEFHERGKNHKENVAAKIAEIKKKSIEKAKQEDRMSKEFAAMEEAALKAFQEDLKRLEAESGTGAARPQSKKAVAEPPAVSSKQPRVWSEGVTDDGYTYYYNSLTGESQWEKPEGFTGGKKTSRRTQVKTKIETQTSSDSPWVEAQSPEGYTYYYNTLTGESSWGKPGDDPPQDGGSSGETSEALEDPSAPQAEPLSGEESSSEQPPSGVELETPKEPGILKISFRKKKEEKSELSGVEGEETEDGKEDDGGAIHEEEEKEEEEDDDDGGDGDNGKNDNGSAPVVQEIPAKRPRKTNPYGEWEQIQEEPDPYEQVDLQLPQVEGVGAATGTDLPPEPKVKFRERTITSLGDEGDQGAVFKKRKLDNGKSRSLRQRGEDD